MFLAYICLAYVFLGCFFLDCVCVPKYVCHVIVTSLVLGLSRYSRNSSVRASNLAEEKWDDQFRPEQIRWELLYLPRTTFPLPQPLPVQPEAPAVKKASPARLQSKLFQRIQSLRIKEPRPGPAQQKDSPYSDGERSKYFKNEKEPKGPEVAVKKEITAWHGQFEQLTEQAKETQHAKKTRSKATHQAKETQPAKQIPRAMETQQVKEKHHAKETSV